MKLSRIKESRSNWMILREKTWTFKKNIKGKWFYNNFFKFNKKSLNLIFNNVLQIKFL